MRGAVVGALVAVLLFATVASALQPGPSQILITDRVTSETISPNQRVIKTVLINRAFPNAIGSSGLICTTIGAARGPIPPGSQLCWGVYRFAHGNIIVSGLMSRRGLYTLSVVGGTGIYSNTGGGQMAAVTIDLDPRVQQLSFTLYST